MLKINLIRKTQEFFKYYAQDTSQEELTIVTPNPGLADLVRNRFDSVGRIVNSVTISKFMKDELNALVSEDVLENYKGKSELILLLGAIWKKIGKGDDYISFKRAFNLLTEFRSFSTSDHVLETVLENYDEELSSGVLWLHRFLNELELVDEHKSYFLLAERLREGDLPPEYIAEKTIVFYGFDFMTASQVDMLKALALRADIIIPFYKEAYERTSNFDWINWFDEHNMETIDLVETNCEEFESSLYRFPKNYLGKQLLSLPICEDKMDIVLGTKNISREQYQEIPFDNMKVKIPVDIFSEDHKKVSQLLEDLILEGPISTNEVREEIQKTIQQFIIDKEHRAIKSCFIYLKKINEWEQLSDENNVLNKFDFNILRESSVLDLPRVNITNLSTETQISLNSLSEIEGIKGKKIAFALNSNHGSIKGVSANYSENVEKYLTSIGPIRRAELDTEVLKSKFSEFIEDNQVMFLIEEGLIEHDTSVSNLFSKINTSTLSQPIDIKNEKKYYDLKKISSDLLRVSASKLQKYLECPRKYYHGYISKLNPSIKFDSELNVLELGQIEHKVIEDYFKTKDELDEEFLEKLIYSILREFLKDKQIEDINEYFIEIKAYTQNAIIALANLKKQYQLKFQFELPFSEDLNSLKYNGSIDLYAANDNLQMVIDFKRSNRVFTSFTSILKFEQVQLWFYYLRLKGLKKIVDGKDIVIGYIDLSNIENSMFFTNNKDVLNDIKKQTHFSKIKHIEEFEEKAQEYFEFEDGLIERLKCEKDFLPNPLKKDSCNFCAIKNICPRE